MSEHDKFHESASEAAKSSQAKQIQALDFDQPGAASTEFYDAPPATPASVPVGLATAKNAPWWHSQFNLMVLSLIHI